MLKTLAVFLTLPLFWAALGHAQTSSEALLVETELDKQADRINVIPAETLIENKRLVTKKIDLKLKNSTTGQISDIIKNKQIIDERTAKMLKEDAPRPVNVNPNNKAAAREYLQKDLKNYNYPK